jgi:carbonic anhydrase/acetyltransferase-like protein (isoleucine patch superfamily)
VPVYSLNGLTPRVDPGAWIAPTAVLIGEVVVEEGASVWFNAVIRADAGPIVVRAGANVQDGSVLHGGHGVTEIGARATIGHCCVVHSAVIGEQALIGNGAIVLDRARVGARTLVAAGSVVSPDSDLPADVLVMGTPARVRGPLTGTQEEWVRINPGEYRKLASAYAAGLTESVAAG